MMSIAPLIVLTDQCKLDSYETPASRHTGSLWQFRSVAETASTRDISIQRGGVLEGAALRSSGLLHIDFHIVYINRRRILGQH